MRTEYRSRHGYVLVLALSCLLTAACSGTDVVEQFVDAALADVDGTWSYQIDNGDQATFDACTGDATILEGLTWNQAQAQGPLCHVDNSFEVTQSLAAMVMTPEDVGCGGAGGTTATITGYGVVGENTVDGRWESSSSQNVDATQYFTGTVSGNTISLSENRRSYGGSFTGACDITPALAATVTIQ